MHALSLFLEGYGLADVWGQWSLPGGSWALWLGEWISFPAYWLLPSLVLLLCPDGHVPSREVEAGRRARRRCCRGQHARLGFPLTGGLGREDASAWPRLAGVDVVVRSCVSRRSARVLGAVAVVLSIVSVFVRYRAAREAERCSSSGCSSARSPPSRCCSARCVLPHAGWALALSSLALPAAVVVAILNGGLWDIDLVVSRSLVYGVLVAGVLGVYVVVVITLGDALGRTTGAPLVATAIVAIGVNPARVWLTKVVNRFVYGYRDDPTAVLHELSDRLDAAGAEDVVQRAADTLRRALRLQSVEVLSGAAEVSGRDEQFPLVYQGEVVGVLLVQPPPGRAALGEESAHDHRRLATARRGRAHAHAHRRADALA